MRPWSRHEHTSLPASGDLDGARALLVQAQDLFAAAGHVLEAKRCRDTELAVREDRSVPSPVS